MQKLVDKLNLMVPTMPTQEAVEQFTISIGNDMVLRMAWDDTMVEVPMTKI
ncbi:MAG: hypothetical protein ACJAZ3_001970 [Sphingobacteriales bacterium]|jgi:hypothetical protein